MECTLSLLSPCMVETMLISGLPLLTTHLTAPEPAPPAHTLPSLAAIRHVMSLVGSPSLMLICLNESFVMFPALMSAVYMPLYVATHRLPLLSVASALMRLSDMLRVSR